MEGQNSTVTLVSTTETAEQVAEALGAKPETPAADATTPAADKPAADKPAADATPAADAGEPEGSAEQTPEQKAAEQERQSKREKRVNKIQAQIDELSAKKHDLRRGVEADEARRAELAREIAELEARKAAAAEGKPEPRAATRPVAGDEPPAATEFSVPKPKLDDVDEQGNPKFKTYEEWVDAKGEWSEAKLRHEFDQRLAAERAEREQSERARIEHARASRDRESHLATYAEKLEEFKQVTPDFDDAYEDAKEDVADIVSDLGPNALDIIDLYTTRDADNGPAIVNYLMRNPNEMRRIAELAPPLQLAALGKIDARMDGAKKTGPSSAAEPVTKAPAPIKPVGSSPTATVNPDDEDYQTYKARRAREEAAARAR